MNGAQVVVQTLLAEGVDMVFGYPGGAVLPIYDALYGQRECLRHILTCHEQAAAHAADGYARASGKTGVVIATSGPGATNLVTGIAAAYMDSTPLVAITGNVPLVQLGRDSFQEIDIAGVTMPITKHNSIVKSPAELAGTLHEAFLIARSGRPGPVLVDIPRDIAESPYGGARSDSPPYRPVKPKLDEETIDALCEELRRARRPVVLCGGGVVISGAGQALTALAERCGAPICATLMGLSAIAWDHPQFLGMVGLHGRAEANRAVSACDLLLAVGTRFTDRVVGDRAQFAPHARVVHIDIDPAEIGKNISADMHMVGDAGEVLAAVLKRFTPAKPNAPIGFAPFSQEVPEAGSPGGLIRAIWRRRIEGMTVVTDVGQHQMWTAQGYGFERSGSFITSGGLGAMGFGMGAAIGTSLARPGTKTVLITGDASFHMNMSELATAVRYRLPITVFVLDNGRLGLVRQLQDTFCAGRHYAVEPSWNTDFVKLAEAMGAKGIHLTDMSCFDDVADDAFSACGPCVVHCVIDNQADA